MARKRGSRERRRGRRRQNRHEKRMQSHSGGGDWGCLKIPEGMEVFKPEDGKTYHIDILHYIVGDYNKNAKKGDEYFELSYPIYGSLGIDEKRYVAIGELLGVRDPVAEHFAKLRNTDDDWDNIKQFKPKERQLMLFFVHEQAEKGLQLFEGSFHTFGKLLDEEIQAEEEDYVDNLDDPDAGATLKVRFKGESIGATNIWIKASKIMFIERPDGFTANGDDELAEEVLAKAEETCLDDLLKITDYETLQKALNGEPVSDKDDDDDDEEEEETPPRRRGKGRAKEAPEEEEEEEEAPKPKRKRKAKKEPEPEPEEKEEVDISKGAEVEHEDFGVCSVVRVSRDGSTATIMDADEEVHKGIPIDELVLIDGELGNDEEEEEEPAPTAKKKTKSSSRGASAKSATSRSKGKKDADEDGDDDDDWDKDW